LLIGMGFFLYGRIANGTLYYYINQKFAGFTLFAMVGLIGVGLAYEFGRKAGGAQAHAHDAPIHDHGHDDPHPHEPGEDGSEHPSHDQAGHSHGLSWGGIALVALPVLLGLLVPPRPLGAAALDNREVVLSVENSALPATVKSAAQTTQERNMLDWWRSFQAADDYSAFTNQEAKFSGFVYKDPRYGDGYFLSARFVVSCCVADAAVVGLVIRWPDAATLENDQWVEVRGKFAASPLEAWRPPVLVAATVTPIAAPAQPYLYP
jgi:uncharacterized repeat protein (TIGR03943 family)